MPSSCMKAVALILVLQSCNVSSFTPFCGLGASKTAARRNTPLTFSSAVTATESEDETLTEIDENALTHPSRSYEDFERELLKITSRKKRRPSCGAEAEAIFDEMYDAYVVSEDPSLWPDTGIYNILLDAHAWSTSKEGGEKAQLILDRMEDMTVETVARPDRVSYMHVMEAWANRNSPESACRIMDRLQKRYVETANPDLRPDTKVYNKLIGAWMRCDARDSAEEAENLLQDMIGQYKAEGDDEIIPDKKTFVQVMRCFGKRKTETDLRKVKELLETMKELYRLTGKSQLQPDTWVYNELISAMVRNKSVENPGQEAEAILYEMMEAANMGNDVLEPNSATFRHVIYGYQGGSDAAVAFKVQQLLELSQGVGLELNAATYDAAIQVIAWTREPEKAALCWKLVQRMKRQEIQPTVRSYNNVLNSCAHSFQPKDPKEVFRISVEAFNELRDSELMSPDVTSYGHFLRCCSQLLPANSKRDAVVKNVFLKCCKDGQVGRFVLSELMEAGSDEAIADLLGSDPEGGVAIPRNWSRNVRDSRQLLR